MIPAEMGKPAFSLGQFCKSLIRTFNGRSLVAEWLPGALPDTVSMSRNLDSRSVHVATTPLPPKPWLPASLQ